jgi:polyisoprenyl-teichoic acid--peptidoglycan teichoic acid transferase
MKGAASPPPLGWSDDHRQSQRQDWTAPLAGFLSSMVPGAGQLYAGRRRRGALMLVLTAVCLLAAALLAQTLREPAARARLIQPEALLILLVGNLLLLGFRIASAADAFWLGARRSRERAVPGSRMSRAMRPLPATLVAVLLFTTLPHAAAAWYNVKAYELVTTVFSSGPIPSRLAGAAAGLGGLGNGVTIPPITVLLIGGDAGPGRTGLRSDTMIVARVDPSTGRAALFGLPRNMIKVPLQGPAADFFGGCRCFPRPLNELYAFAENERPDLFPGNERPGVNALTGAAEALLDLQIDYYALVDLRGFVGVVDALGGVTVDVQEKVWVEIDNLGMKRNGAAYFMRPGKRHMNGVTALAYSRSRNSKNEDGGNDYGRMRRQRCLLGALAAQADPVKLLTSFNTLSDVMKKYVKTNIPIRLLPDLITALGEHRPQVTTIGFAPPTFNSGWSNHYPVPNVAKIRRAVRNTIASPPTTNAAGSKATTTTRAPGEGSSSGTSKRTTTTREVDHRSGEADTCGAVR